VIFEAFVAFVARSRRHVSLNAGARYARLPGFVTGSPFAHSGQTSAE
jgi:hypothetical protein